MVYRFLNIFKIRLQTNVTGKQTTLINLLEISKSFSDYWWRIQIH